MSSYIGEEQLFNAVGTALMKSRSCKDLEESQTELAQFFL